MTDLVVFERNLQPLLPDLSAMMRGGPLRQEKLVATLKESFRRNPDLLSCTMDSLLQCAMTAADLWLEPGQVLGQFFMLPFTLKGRGRIAQPCIGYKGYNTLGAREGLTIDGKVVREGDAFRFGYGTSPFVEHEPKQGNKGRIVRAWAAATAPGRTPVVVVTELDEILELKARNPAVKAKMPTPWTDEKIGFPAMAEKTPKRRLGRALPIGAFLRAAIMEEAFEERGKHSYISHGGVVVEGEAAPVAPVVPTLGPAQPPPPKEQQAQLGLQVGGDRFLVVWGKSPGNRRYYRNIEEWRSNAVRLIHELKGDDPVAAKKKRVRPRRAEDKLEAMRELMGEVFDDLHRDFPKDVEAVIEALDRRLGRRGRQ